VAYLSLARLESLTKGFDISDSWLEVQGQMGNQKTSFCCKVIVAAAGFEPPTKGL